MCDIIETLKDPNLVFQFQTLFGVERIDPPKSETETLTKDPTDNPENRGENHERNFKINNKFWYFLFCFATELGDIVFYALFIPFWFWNIDAAIGRRFIVVWAVVMYIGQVLKDIIKWPRPGAPAIQLQTKWSLEYGMPSTHATVAVAIPFSFIYFSVERYECPIPLSCLIIFGILWAALICASRVYLGMHSVLDIIAGILLAAIIMSCLVPVSDRIDHFLLTNTWSPAVIVALTVLLIVYYPKAVKWTPTRGDTCCVLASSVGLLTGAWLLYTTGEMQPRDILSDTLPKLTEPYEIFWTSLQQMGPPIVFRTIIGLALIVASLQVFKWMSVSLLCAIFCVDAKTVKSTSLDVGDKVRIFIDLSTKYFTYSVTGFIITYFTPFVYKKLGLERARYYSEV